MCVNAVAPGINKAPMHLAKTHAAKALLHPVKSIYVVIEEMELDNWGWGGIPAAQYRRKCLSGHIR